MKENITLTLDKEFLDYCKLNNIEDIEGTAKKVFNNGFTILKYGANPSLYSPKKQPISRPIEPTEVVIIDPIKVTYESTNIPPQNPIKLISKGKEELYNE